MKLRILRYFERGIGRRRIIRRTPHGFLMALDQQEVIQRRILYEGTWEREVTSLLETEFGPEEIFFDIGANIGYFSCLAAACGVRQVIAFEPDPFVCSILLYNLDLNRWSKVVSIRQNALSDAPGAIPFQRSSDSCVSGFGIWDRNVIDTFDVEAVTLDSIPLEGGPKPTIIKIDVEGWEQRVLAGAGQIFSVSPPRLVIFETYAAPTGQMTSSWIHDFFSRHDYEISHLPRADGTMDWVENYVARRKTPKPR
jgi:FkbM family methyltransferase